MAVIRTATGLKQVQDQTLKERMDQLNQQQVTTALGAQSVGATPKQQDMAGSQAHKTAVIQQNLAPKEAQVNLADRYVNKAAALDTAQQSKLDEARKLAGLAGLGTRVQKLAETRANAAAAQPVQLNYDKSLLASALKAAGKTGENDYTAAATAMSDYAHNPGARDKALADLTNMGISPAAAHNMLETADAALGRSADPTAITASDLDNDIKDLGYTGGIEALNTSMQALGLPGVNSTMKVEDLTKAVGAYRDKITSQKAELEAAAMGQTGMQQGAAMNKVQNFVQAGGQAAEQGAKQALQPIDMASTIKVGDQEMKVDEFLKDQEFSDLIEEWTLAKTPEEREKLIPSKGAFGPLSEWLSTNEKALKAAAGGIDTATAAATKAGADQANLGTDVIIDKKAVAALLPGVDLTAEQTPQQLQATKAKLEATPVFKAAAADSSGNTKKYLNTLSPDQVKYFADKPEEQIYASQRANTLMSGSTELQGRYAKKYGLDPTQPNTYTQAQYNEMNDFNNLVPEVKTLSNQPQFKNLSNAHLKLFTSENGTLNKTMAEEYAQFIDEQNYAASEMSDAQNTDKVFGAGTAAALNAGHADMEARARYGDASAVAELEKFKTMDRDNSGTIDATDAKTFLSERKTRLTGKTIDNFKDLYKGNQYSSVAEGLKDTSKSVLGNVGAGVYSRFKDALQSGDFSKLKHNNPDDVNAVQSMLQNLRNSGKESGPEAAALGQHLRNMGAENTRSAVDAVKLYLNPAAPNLEEAQKLIDRLKSSSNPLDRESAVQVENNVNYWKTEQEAAKQAKQATIDNQTNFINLAKEAEARGDWGLAQALYESSKPAANTGSKLVTEGAAPMDLTKTTTTGNVPVWDMDSSYGGRWNKNKSFAWNQAHGRKR